MHAGSRAESQAIDHKILAEAEESIPTWKYVMRCAIWHYFYNLKNVKNTHGGVLIF